MDALIASTAAVDDVEDDDDHAALPLPAFSNQVAGHKGMSHEGGAILVPEPGKIAKPVGRGYFAGEDRFYRELSSYPAMAKFCPAYSGTQTINGRDYVILEDLTYGMKRPLVVDVKVGTCTVASDAQWTKRITHLAKDRATTTRSLGLRVTGAQSIASGSSVPIRLGKRWGKALCPDEMAPALRMCFSEDGGRLCTDALRTFVPLLKELAQVLEDSPRWQLVSSSLLFVFQSDADAAAAKQQQQHQQASANSTTTAAAAAPHSMRVIDFAHAYPLKHTCDPGYLYGLRNLIQILEGFLNDDAPSPLPTTPPLPRLRPDDDGDAAVFSVDLSLPPGEVGHTKVGRDGVERLEASSATGKGGGTPAERIRLYADEFLESLAHSPLGVWSKEWLGFQTQTQQPQQPQQPQAQPQQPTAAPALLCPPPIKQIRTRRADTAALSFPLGGASSRSARGASFEKRVRSFLQAFPPGEAEALCAAFSSQMAAMIATLTEGTHFSFASATLTLRAPAAGGGDGKKAGGDAGDAGDAGAAASAPLAQLAEFAEMALERDLGCNQACLATLHSLQVALSKLILAL